MKILVTGGAGFIGSALIRYILGNTKDAVVNVDKLTYAGSIESLSSIKGNKNYFFERVDICSAQQIRQLFNIHQPDAVVHLAAESHVDRSIHDAAAFINTNIVGTHVMLEESWAYCQSLSTEQQKKFRFYHISTDEVYGDLKPNEPEFTEETRYAPNSPYSASKASSDHLVRAWHKTYGLPVVITNCSNNYGPYQFPEKLIPLMIKNALAGQALPVYGNGLQIRDWLFVDDHARAIYKVLTQGKIGETYNIGGHNEKTNLQVVQTICNLLEELVPEKPNNITYYADLITHVHDRPGHDQRYAINASKIEQELHWRPYETFESGLYKTVAWYIANRFWLESVPVTYVNYTPIPTEAFV